MFYEQYSDKIYLKIKFYLNNEIKEEEKSSINEQFVIIPSFKSLIFIVQILLVSLSFVATLLSYKHTGY